MENALQYGNNEFLNFEGNFVIECSTIVLKYRAIYEE